MRARMTKVLTGAGVAAVAVVLGGMPATADIAARRAYEFVDSVGLCSHFGWRVAPYETTFDQMQSAIEELGIRYVRQRPRAPLGMKRLTELGSGAGVRWQAVVDMTDEANFKARELVASAAPDTIRIAERGMGDALIGFEGPNEYDNTQVNAGNADWAQDLRTFMSALYGAAKSDPATSALPVIAPSLAKNTPEMFGQLGNLTSVSDRGNLHAYSGERPLGVPLDDFIALANMTNPGQPIVISEYGWHTASAKWQAHPLTDQVRAKYLARAMAAIFTRPIIERAFIYQLVDPGDNPELDSPAMHFGLINNDLMRTPSFYAVRNMMHLLCDSDSGFTPRPLPGSLGGDMQNVRSFLAQKSSGVWYLALWQEAPSYEPPKPRNKLQARALGVPPKTVTLAFSAPVGSVRTYLPTALDGDADGGKKPKSTYDAPTSVALSVPDEVMLVEITPPGVSPPGTPDGCRFEAGRR